MEITTAYIGNSKIQNKEKSLLEKGKSVGFPGWDKVESERRELEPQII